MRVCYIALFVCGVIVSTDAINVTVPEPPFKPINETENRLRNRTKIHVAALVPYKDTWDPYMFYSAMYTALRLINADDTILKDYELVIDFTDSSTLIGYAYVAFYSSIKKQSKQVIIGPAFAKTTKAIAELSTLYKIPQISYSTLQVAGSQTQAENEGSVSKADLHFPYLAKATPSIFSFNDANVNLLQYFKWGRIAILYEYSTSQFFSTAYDLSVRLKNVGIKVEMIQGFSNYFAAVDTQMKLLQAYQRKLYGPKYQWIVVSTLSPTWWQPIRHPERINCTTKDLLEVSKGYMTLAKTLLRNDDVKIIKKLTALQIWGIILQQIDYERRVQEIDRNSPSEETGIYPESTFAFDAVLMAAKALDNVLKEKGPAGLMTEYYDSEKAKYITNAMFNSSFEGITGRFEYGGKSGVERQGDIRVLQFKVNNNGTAGLLEDIGNFNIKNKTTKMFKTPPEIFEAQTVIKDRVTVMRIPRMYSLNIIGTLWGFVVAGLILCFVVSFINIKYRNIRLIKMSSPNINNGIILGSLLCYIAVIIYGLDARFLSNANIWIACNTVTIVLSLGFTLSFGCLFSKTWRIYKIFTAAKTMEKVAIKDVHLYFIIAGLVCVDVFVFIVWILVSPFRVEEIELEQKEFAQDDFIEMYFYHKCNCQYQLHFTVAVYCYKGFLLIFGLFLAWETRNVKVAVLNDSKYIGMAVYNVCIISTVGVICTSALYSTQNYATGYLVVAISIFLSTTGTLLLIFVPKIYLLFGKSHDVTYGNVAVRSFSSNVTGKSRKSQLSYQASRTSSNVNQTGQKSMYDQNRFRQPNVLMK